MLEMFSTPQFWADVFKIIMIDLLLSGDNAVVIALACRNLPVEQRRKGILFGVGGAIGLRIVLTFFAVSLLALPYLKLIGALLLIWIGIKLILPEEEHSTDNIKADTRLLGAIKTIIIADFVMSLDNVIAVAAAAKDSWTLIVFGLLLSIPIIVYCSQLVLKLMERWPVIITLGGMLLGYIAGDMMARDPVIIDWVKATAEWAIKYHIAGFVGAAIVLAVGKLIASRTANADGGKLEDLAAKSNDQSKH